REIEDLKSLHLQASQASDKAKSAVNQNSALLQKKLGEPRSYIEQSRQMIVRHIENDLTEQARENVVQWLDQLGLADVFG
ncbi:MAG: PspA/IM30 family protein, partial [Chloroflexota bacterium]